MIELPTKRILTEKRKALYDILTKNICNCSVERVEHLMRQIHKINFKLNIYFKKKKQQEE